jgi:chromosome segregation ATPase
MTDSPLDPEVIPKPTIRQRFAWSVGRRLEPLVLWLLDWCRGLETRVGNLERRVEEGERRASSDLTEIEGLESRTVSLEGRAELAFWGREALVERINELGDRTEVEAIQARIVSLEARAEDAFWGSEAVVERMNVYACDNEGLMARVTALEEETEQGYWAREALVERLNQAHATESTATQQFETLRRQIDEHFSTQLAFGLDALAMGRRLSALEDHVESLLVQGEATRDDRAAPTLVRYSPRDQEGDKAAG